MKKYALNKALHDSREAVEEHLVASFGKAWKEKYPGLEIVEVIVPGASDDDDESPTTDSRKAALEVFDFFNELVGRHLTCTFGPGRSGSMAAARYAELRREGLTHENAVETMKEVVKWCYRNWWPNPSMKAYVKPDSIFRKTKFHERRTVR